MRTIAVRNPRAKTGPGASNYLPAGPGVVGGVVPPGVPGAVVPPGGAPPGVVSGVVGEVVAGGGGTSAGFLVSGGGAVLSPQPPIRSADVIINAANTLPVFIGHSPNPTIRHLLIPEFLQADGIPGVGLRAYPS
jgi:hypothetical protein